MLVLKVNYLTITFLMVCTTLCYSQVLEKKIVKDIPKDSKGRSDDYDRIIYTRNLLGLDILENGFDSIQIVSSPKSRPV